MLLVLVEEVAVDSASFFLFFSFPTPSLLVWASHPGPTDDDHADQEEQQLRHHLAASESAPSLPLRTSSSVLNCIGRADLQEFFYPV